MTIALGTRAYASDQSARVSPVTPVFRWPSPLMYFAALGSEGANLFRPALSLHDKSSCTP